MKLETIQALRYVIIAFMCYVPTVSIAGWFEAFAAKKLGDTVPEHAGFLTLNPFVHFNPWGFLLMFINVAGFGFAGFGTLVPLAPQVLMGRYRNLRAALEFFARPFIHFCMMFAVFLLLIIAFHTVYIGIEVGVFAMPNSYSSLQLAICTLLGFFFQQNFYLFIVYTFVGAFRFVSYLYFPRLEIQSLMGFIIALLLFAILATTLGIVLQNYTQLFLFFVQSYIL